ncbi:MAG: DUF4234 domain-containing protein [Candidatus Methylarchaceae archaeon HK02M1]|nr:DUF4234 domain-containing protein [Candidatus Methylarchaceae archaeon HK02M1]
MSVEIENIRKDIRMRVETDSMMSIAWIFVYIIPIFSAILLPLSLIFIWPVGVTIGPPSQPSPPSPIFIPLLIWVVLLPILLIIGFIVSIILIYMLVKRRNTHFKRQIFLFDDILKAVRAIAAKRGVNAEIELASCERTVREAKAEETEKSAVLWAILSAFIFLADWYVRYFLMRDFYKHERREEGFWEDVGKAMDKCGIKFSMPRRVVTLPDRSFVLYLILTIITLGIFGIYWLYVLLKDPNEHFEYHIKIEDDLLSIFESVTV